MTTRGNRSGSLQDGAIVPSDLLTSQKGTPLLVHPMLHPNIGSPRDAATLGEIGSAFPATHVSPLQSVFICFSHLPSIGGGGGGGGVCILVTHKISSSVAKHQIIIACTVRSVPPHVRACLINSMNKPKSPPKFPSTPNCKCQQHKFNSAL